MRSGVPKWWWWQKTEWLQLPFQARPVHDTRRQHHHHAAVLEVEYNVVELSLSVPPTSYLHIPPSGEVQRCKGPYLLIDKADGGSCQIEGQFGADGSRVFSIDANAHAVPKIDRASRDPQLHSGHLLSATTPTATLWVRGLSWPTNGLGSARE